MSGEKTKLICKKFWNQRIKCNGCPLFAECSTWYPTTLKSIEEHATEVEKAAIRYMEGVS